MRYKITAAGTLLYDSAQTTEECGVLEPKCKRERGKAGTITFAMVPTHPLYNSLNRLKTEVVCTEDDVEIFRGRVYEIETDIWKQRNVTCEGDLSYLVDSLQPPDRKRTTTTETISDDYTYDYDDYGPETGSGVHGSGHNEATMTNVTEEGVKETVLAHLTRLITKHNEQVESWKQFTLGNVTIDEKNTEVEFDASNYRDTMNAIDSDIINYYGGYLQTRRVGNTTYLDYIKEETTTAAQTLNFGVNMVDLTETRASDDVFTCLVPVGDDECTIASVNNNQIYLENAEAVAKYGKIYKTQSFSGVTEPSKLLELANKYMQKNCKVDPVKFSITALDMKNLGVDVAACNIGTKIRVISAPHSIDKTIECLSIEIKMDAPEETSFELGDPEETLSERYSKDSRSSGNSAADARASSRSSSEANQQLYKYIKEDITKNRLFITAENLEIQSKLIEALKSKMQIFAIESTGMTVLGGLLVNGNTGVRGHIDAEGGITIGGNIVGLVVGRPFCFGGSIDVDVDYTTRNGYVTDVWVSNATFTPDMQPVDFYTKAGEKPSG